MEKITVYSHECNSTYDMNQYITSDKGFAVTGVYLHGDLESIVGYDIVYVPILASINDMPYTLERRIARYNAVTNELPLGIYDVIVKADDKEYLAKAHIYSDTNHKPEEGAKLRGLIVLPEDTESLEYALKCYNEKKQHL